MKAEYTPPGYPPGKFSPVAGSAGQGGSSAGRFFGCAAVGCGAILLLLIAVCGVGYWGLFYSSWPVQAFVSSINQSGEAEIEGVRGNLSTGFEVDKIRFRDPEQPAEEWSEIRGLRVKYHPLGPFWNRQGFEIDDVHIESARLAVDLDSDIQASSDLDLDKLVDGILDARKAQRGARTGGGDFVVRQVLLKDISLVDRNSARELKLEELRFDGMEVRSGKLVRLGDVTVRSDLLEVESGASPRLATEATGRRIAIRLKRQIAPLEMLDDLPITIDIGTGTNGQFEFAVDAMGGAVTVEALPEKAVRLELHGFDPEKFFSADTFGVLPSDVRLTADIGADRKWVLPEGAPASMRLGATQFELALKGGASRELKLEGTAVVAGRDVRAVLTAAGRAPLLMVHLEQEGDWSDEELWAQTVHGRAFSELDVSSRQAINRALERLSLRKALPAGSGSPSNPPDVGSVGDDGGGVEGGDDRELGSVGNGGDPAGE